MSMSWIAGFAWGAGVVLVIVILTIYISLLGPGPDSPAPRATLIPPVEYTPRP